ncbi:hypothetical protein GQ53DRAFT_743107 [Thozetella sp. PMI_491]|nr:hypothetical protein GQ53DRAFT_743107 [Thozetella sp. PMI_491]
MYDQGTCNIHKAPDTSQVPSHTVFFVTTLPQPDPNNTALVSCCAPSPVYLAKPCALWCEASNRYIAAEQYHNITAIFNALGAWQSCVNHALGDTHDISQFALLRDEDRGVEIVSASARLTVSGFWMWSILVLMLLTRT